MTCKQALILAMKRFNHTCAYKARPFRLPTLEGMADLLCSLWGGGGGQTYRIAASRSAPAST